MSMLPIILVAAVAFAVAAFVLRLPRSGWALFAAGLLIGLAGYALQGNPGLAGSPKPYIEEANETGPVLIDTRRELFDPTLPPSGFVTLADGFARRGQFSDAAGILRGAVAKNPDDTEAWLALGNALIEHANGTPTPAALYAYARAEEIDPGHPGAAYFLGIAFIRGQRPLEARAMWARMIENAPPDASWLPAMQERLARLDQMLGREAAQ